MKPVYVINHKAAMDDAFPQIKGKAACHVCRNAQGPAKAREGFACTKSLPMDAPHCPSFHDARRPSFDYSKVNG